MSGCKNVIGAPALLPLFSLPDSSKSRHSWLKSTNLSSITYPHPLHIISPFDLFQNRFFVPHSGHPFELSILLPSKMRLYCLIPLFNLFNPTPYTSIQIC